MKNIEDILAENVEKLMSAHIDLNSQAKLGKKSGVGQRTVGRILNKEGFPTADKLAKIAAAFELMPWQLLVPDLDPANTPLLKEQSPKEREFYKRIADLAIEMGIKNDKQ